MSETTPFFLSQLTKITNSIKQSRDASRKIKQGKEAPTDDIDFPPEPVEGDEIT